MDTTHTESETTTRKPAPDRMRIVSTPGTCGGKPRIDGHRITVEDVVIWHERLGMSPDEIATTYPTITLSDVYAALAYDFDNRAAIDADIAAGAKFVQEMKEKFGPGPLQELARRRNANAPDSSLPAG